LEILQKRCVTGIKDYIHFVDLDKGHIKALQKINEIEYESIKLVNGTRLFSS
tara:strand:+ start:7263 stop:7418 length:156 start_codon:yes stop_codon:yes gene_type:complete